MNNIYLTGMMGSGKTLTAQLVAKRLEREAVDVDTLIVEREGCLIADIFAKRGEPYFRSVERDVLAQVARRERLVVATGGGIILDEQNRALMKKTGVVIFLKASVDALYERIKTATDRPLLKTANPRETLEHLSTARASLYAAGDVTIDTTDRTPDEVVQEILAYLKKEHRL